MYDLDLASAAGLESGGSMVDFRLRSEVVLHARSLPNGSIELAGAMPNAAFETMDPGATAKFSAVAEELKAPFVFTLANGHLIEVRPRPTWSRFADSISRTLAAALQVGHGKDPNAAVWVGHETDATGDYDAEYRCTSALALSKRKVRYEAVSAGTVSFGQVSAKLAPEIVASEGTMTLKETARLLGQVSYQEKLALPLGKTGRITSSTRLTLRFNRVDGNAPSFDWDQAVLGTKRLAPADAIQPASPEDAYDSTRIGDYTFATALAELERYSKDPKANALVSAVRDVPVEGDALRARESLLRDQGRVFNAMAAILRSKPETVPLAVRAIRRGSAAQTALMDALASGGTPEAQGALLALMEDQKADAAIQGGAAYALMRVTKATSAVVDALSSRVGAGPLRVHALYGLGTIARHLRESGEAARASAITTTLVKALRDAETPAVQVHVLRGIANSGDPAALDAVRPFLSAGVTKVRAAAVDAVRLVPGADVDSIIADRLGKDEESIQLSALDAIVVREPSDVLVHALERAASSAEKPVVRIKAVRVAEQLLPKRPDLRIVLQRLASESEFEQVRVAAASALHG